MFYQIRETLVEAEVHACLRDGVPFAVVLTPEVWARECARLGLEFSAIPEHPHRTSIEIRSNSITGALCIPDRQKLGQAYSCFGFALNGRCAVLIDPGDTAQSYLQAIQRTKRWHEPCLERFLHDLLESIVAGDLDILEGYESRIDTLEDEILAGREKDVIAEIAALRRELRSLQLHYEQLCVLAEELEENENDFFSEAKLCHFQRIGSRVSRLLGTLSTVQERSIQLRELYQSRLDLRQNHVMTVLTIVTTIFLPLTLITGWYGMNFEYMPELKSPAGYPIVITVSLAIAGICLGYFKHRKLL